MNAEEEDPSDGNGELLYGMTPYVRILTLVSVVNAIPFQPRLNTSPPNISLPSVSLPCTSPPASILLYVKPP